MFLVGLLVKGRLGIIVRGGFFVISHNLRVGLKGCELEGMDLKTSLILIRSVIFRKILLW